MGKKVLLFPCRPITIVRDVSDKALYLREGRTLVMTRATVVSLRLALLVLVEGLG